MNRTNNKEDITLIWFDSNIDSNNRIEQTNKQLHQINDYIVFHTELKSCINSVKSINNEKIVFISSIYDAPQILQHIINLPQLDSVFVLNLGKLDHEHLVLEQSKLIGIYDEFDLLCLSIQDRIDFLDQNLQTFSFYDQGEYLTKDLSKQTADLIWFQLYHDILFELTYDEDAKQEMIDVCRSYYQNNIKELEMIEKFKNEYRSEYVLQWYREKIFLYKMIKKALRTKDFNQLYIFRYFMKDLTESFVRENQKMVQSGEEILFMYRGMKLTSDQIEKFKENTGKLVSINGFFITNSLRSIALNQAMRSSEKTDLIPVLIEIQCDPQHLSNSVIITNSDHFNEYLCEQQQEILFDSNVTFRLVCAGIEEDIWLIKMTVSNEGQIIKEKYIKDSHRQMEDVSTRILFGRLMCDIGQWDQSQHFFQLLLNNSNSNNEDLATIEFSLGEVLQWKGEWSEARKYYNHAYDRIMNVKPTKIKDSAKILFNIGEILYLEGKYEEAYDYYEQVLAIRKQNYSFSKNVRLCPSNHQRNSLLNHIRMSSFGSASLNSRGFAQSCCRWYCTTKFRRISRWYCTVKFRQIFFQFPSKYATNKVGLIGKQLSKRRLVDKSRNVHEIDSLQTNQINRGSDVLIAATLRSFGNILFQQVKYDEALIFHQQALTILEEYYQYPHIDIAVSFGYIGSVLMCQEKYDKALDFCQRAISIYTGYYPNGHIYTASTLDYIGYILYLEKMYDEALKIYEQELAMLQKYYPCGHVNIAYALCGIGSVHCGQRKYDEAITFYKQTLDIAQKYYFPGHSNIICTLNHIGYVQRKQQKHNEALDFHRRALALQEKYYPMYYANIAHTLNDIGDVLIDQEKYDETLKFYNRALEMQEKYYPNSHVDIATTLNKIGRTFRRQKKFDKAIEYHQKALEIQEKHYLSDSVIIIDTINPSGHVLYEEKQYDAVNDYFRRALSTQENFYPDGHIETSRTLDSIGRTLYKQKKYDEAIQVHQKALTIQEKQFRLAHVDVADSLNNIGNILCSQEKYDQAIDFYQRSLAIREKFDPFGYAGIAAVLRNIGLALHEQEKYDKALNFYQRALAVQENFDAINHVGIVDILINIANTLRDQGRYNEAIEFQQRALTIREDKHSTCHELIANSLNHIGHIRLDQREYSLALECYQRALTILKNCYPSGDVNIAQSLRYIGDALYVQGKYEEAFDFCQQALTIYEQHYPSGHENLATCLNNIGNIYSD
ncbi:unnamed protein product [Rotaria sp. Silwood1]|nr:unnamed protein product [Rotaria sp. Silwood1]